MAVIMGTIAPHNNVLQSKRDFDSVKPQKTKPSVEAEGNETENNSDSKQTNHDGKLKTTSIISGLPNLYKQNGISMSNHRFIKFIPCEASDWLQENHPNAFLLLCLIAKRARRVNGHPDGLEIGMAQIGDYRAAGIESERKYRTAKDVLVRIGAIKIVETARKRKKSTIGTTTRMTTVGTLVTILKSDIWDINIIDEDDRKDDRKDDRATTERRPSDDEQEDRLDRSDLIDLEKSDLDFDEKTMICFEHQKKGIVKAKIEDLQKEFQKQGWQEQEIFQAIKQMKETNPKVQYTIQKYLLMIMKNNRNEPKKEKIPEKPKVLSNKDQYLTKETMKDSPLAKTWGYLEK